MDGFGPDNAFWINSEWVPWDSFDWDDGADDPSSMLERLEREAEFKFKFPNADIRLLFLFRRLRSVAADHFLATGRHLRISGELGELFSALVCGMKRHRRCAAGSDGRLANDFIEVKTIGPDATNDKVKVKAQGHFSKLMIVKIDESYRLQARLIDRKDLKNGGTKNLSARWSDFDHVLAYDSNDFPDR